MATGRSHDFTSEFEASNAGAGVNDDAIHLTINLLDF